YDFGWVVPLLTPEGWLGMVRDLTLEPFAPGVRAIPLVFVVVAWIAGAFLLWRRGRFENAAAAIAVVAPVAIGWAMLALESRHRDNASYDAYKILSVFLPVLLPGMWC